MGLHQEILPRLVEICTSIHPVCGVVLIGSVARGMERADSDVDLNILFPGDDCPLEVSPYIAADNRWQLKVKDEIEGIRIDVAWETEHGLMDKLSGDGAMYCWPFSNGRMLHDPRGVAGRSLKIAQAWFAERRDDVARNEAEYAAAKAEQLRRRQRQ